MTAYEMRISDWSSDECSSDLLDPAALSPLLGIEDDMTNRATRLIALFEASGQIDEARLKAIKYDTAYAKTGYAKAWIDKLLALDTRDDPALAEEIGSASCRESGCQYG